jgi:hypothetical protein
MRPTPNDAARFMSGLAAMLLSGCVAPTATHTSTGQVGGAQLTAVYSRASKDYVRTQNPDGSFQPETFKFKEGGNFGGPRFDITIDKLTFDDVKAVIGPQLAAQNYVESDDRAATKLLIMVYWGVTVVPDDVNPKDARESSQLAEDAERAAGALAVVGGIGSGAAVGTDAHQAQLLQDQMRDMSELESKGDAIVDARNSNILGYTDEILRTRPHDPNMVTLQEEVERDRYYVVLLAYDYQMGRKFGRHELLWETRFSIPEPGNDFDKAFPMMAAIAGKYFGDDSHGLIHHNLANTNVEIGEPKSMGALPEK